MEGGAWVSPASQAACLLKTPSLGPDRPLPLGSSCPHRSPEPLSAAELPVSLRLSLNPSSGFRCL